jgi:hypothetical protein
MPLASMRFGGGFLFPGFFSHLARRIVRISPQWLKSSA